MSLGTCRILNEVGSYCPTHSQNQQLFLRHITSLKIRTALLRSLRCIKSVNKYHFRIYKEGLLDFIQTTNTLNKLLKTNKMSCILSLFCGIINLAYETGEITCLPLAEESGRRWVIFITQRKPPRSYGFLNPAFINWFNRIRSAIIKREKNTFSLNSTLITISSELKKPCSQFLKILWDYWKNSWLINQIKEVLK